MGVYETLVEGSTPSKHVFPARETGPFLLGRRIDEFRSGQGKNPQAGLP